jgi:ferredoxin-nitrite reductase
MVGLGALADELGDDIRLTRQQNFVLTGVAEADLDVARQRLVALGLPLDVNTIRGLSIGCTGEPHCNFAVTETKTRLGTLIEGLEQRFGQDVEELRLHSPTAAHTCGQHWVGDIGFQERPPAIPRQAPSGL